MLYYVVHEWRRKIVVELHSPTTRTDEIATVPACSLVSIPSILTPHFCCHVCLTCSMFSSRSQNTKNTSLSNVFDLIESSANNLEDILDMSVIRIGLGNMYILSRIGQRALSEKRR